MAGGILYGAIMHQWVSGSFYDAVRLLTFQTACFSSTGVLTVLVLRANAARGKTINPYPFFIISRAPRARWTEIILLMSVMVSHFSFALISLYYRIDHHLGRPEELTINLPNVRGTIVGAEDVVGTVFMPSYPGTTSSIKTRTRFPLYYSRAAFLGWLGGYISLAALSACSYVQCSWEFSIFIAEIFSYPLMALFVFIAAVLRGELRFIWTYTEDWSTAPFVKSDIEAPAISVTEVAKKNEGAGAGAAGQEKKNAG